jgi:oxaloacetate decarboxylase alpha subunit
VDSLRKQYPNASDDERLLRAMFAGGQVDAMREAGATRTNYEFEQPMVRLVRELASRRMTRIHISRREAPLLQSADAKAPEVSGESLP